MVKFNICAIGVPEGEEKENQSLKAEPTFKEIMAQIVQN